MKLKKTAFRSGAELKFASYLKEKRVRFKYEEDSIPYIISETRHYKPDFKLIKDNGEPMYIEVKGFFSPADRKKMLLVKESNPAMDVRMLFMSDNRISKRSKTRYSEWCNKHNLAFHIGMHLPKAWIDELG
jgi:hypothetical protein